MSFVQAPRVTDIAALCDLERACVRASMCAV